MFDSFNSLCIWLKLKSSSRSLGNVVRKSSGKALNPLLRSDKVCSVLFAPEPTVNSRVGITKVTGVFFLLAAASSIGPVAVVRGMATRLVPRRLNPRFRLVKLPYQSSVSGSHVPADGSVAEIVPELALFLPTFDHFPHDVRRLFSRLSSFRVGKKPRDSGIVAKRLLERSRRFNDVRSLKALPAMTSRPAGNSSPPFNGRMDLNH